ncbi:MAG: hypothetical protein AB8B57_17285 [Congregibacter sp.]
MNGHVPSVRSAPGMHRRQSGVALAIVVWFIAGMSLLVASVVLSARNDVRLAQLHVGRAQATAAGDGAIALLLADIRDGQFAGDGARGAGLAQQQYQLGEHSVTVVAVPIEWLVDLNTAPQSLLVNAMQSSGGFTPDDAESLAAAVVQWRSGTAGGRASRFEATEDLLSVEGMNRASWDSIRDFVGIAQGRAALASLSGRAGQSLSALEALRPASRVQQPGLMAPDARPPGSSRGASGGYRVDALLEVGDRFWLRRRWITMSGSTGFLPWRVERTEPVRIVQRGERR